MEGLSGWVEDLISPLQQAGTSSATQITDTMLIRYDRQIKMAQLFLGGYVLASVIVLGALAMNTRK